MAETHTKAPAGAVTLENYPDFKRSKKSELRRQRGWIRQFSAEIVRWISTGIAYEARDDWQRVKRCSDMIGARLFKDGAVRLDVAEQLATADAYLELAREVRDLAETWSFVNQASEILCCLANDDEKEAIVHRLAIWEPILKRWLGELYDQENVATELENSLGDGSDICRKLTVHAQLWQLVNQWISFTRRLWRFALFILAVTLVLAITIAEMLYVIPKGADGQSVSVVTDDPFIWVSLLGLFGGALSALLNVNDRKVTAVTYGQSKTQLFIRLVLGACGGFVVYVLVNVPGLFQDAVVEFFRKGLFGFIALGIVAGFSERLFLGALEKAASKFPTTGGDRPPAS